MQSILPADEKADTLPTSRRTGNNSLTPAPWLVLCRLSHRVHSLPHHTLLDLSSMTEWNEIDLRVPTKQAWQQSEHDFQKRLVAALNQRIIIEPALALLYAVPNGGMRNKATAGKLRAEGVKSGVPDLFLSVPATPYHGLYLELKAKGNTASPDQRRWLLNLSAQGYKCAVVNDMGTALRIVAEYLRNPKLS